MKKLFKVLRCIDVIMYRKISGSILIFIRQCFIISNHERDFLKTNFVENFTAHLFERKFKMIGYFCAAIFKNKRYVTIIMQHSVVLFSQVRIILLTLI